MVEIIQKVINNGPENFDIERIHNYIKRGLIKNQKKIENSPHLFFPDATLLDKVYGRSKEHFATFVSASQWTTEYLQKDAAFWLGLMEEIFVKR